ncbi:unnamed protein product [Ceratitis capitata]|uniref:(Mediterranean fruit fly) hypothetical protein n=2 Tax=Ceratitis capitata TaxID=7213 RepID=A0A811UWT7_CERCA|nr:unnamed protein product [Ceratitis capitata]
MTDNQQQPQQQARTRPNPTTNIIYAYELATRIALSPPPRTLDVACTRQSRSRQREPAFLTPARHYQQYYEEGMHTPVHQQQLEHIKTQYLSHQHDITIDRDTVLKINRLATRRNLHKRDHSWPPPCSDYTIGREQVADETRIQPTGSSGGTQSLTHSRSASKEYQQQQPQQQQQARTNKKKQGGSSSCTCNNNAVHFTESVCKRHGIDAIREKFNTVTLTKQKQKLQKNATNKSARVNDSSRETRSTSVSATAEASGAGQQTLTNVHNNMANTSSVNVAVDALGPTTSKPIVATTTNWPAAIENDEASGKETIVATTTSSEDAFDDYNTPMARGFSAPETKAADENIGLVEPRRCYFEQLARREVEVPKKWHSYDNIAAATMSEQQQQQFISRGMATAATINNKRQSQSLDRGRRREQLPPLKPRSGGGGSASGGSSPAARMTPASSITEVNVMTCGKGDYVTSANGRSSCLPVGNPSKPSGAAMSPRVQRRAIKLATEIKICYDDMDADESIAFENGRSASDRKPYAETINIAEQQTKQRTSPKSAGVLDEEKTINVHQISDLEQIPLPAPPSQSGRNATAPVMYSASRRAGEMGSTRAFELQRIPRLSGQISKQQQQNKYQRRSNSESNLREPHATRVIPIELKPENAVNHAERHQVPPRRDLSTVSADQIYDDACIYLRSIDLDDRTVAYIPAAITIVPSPTEELLQHWTAGESSQTSLKAGIVTRRKKEGSSESTYSSTCSAPPTTQPSSSRTVATQPKTDKQTTNFHSDLSGKTHKNGRQSAASDVGKTKNKMNPPSDRTNEINKKPSDVTRATKLTDHNATERKVCVEPQQQHQQQRISSRATTRNHQPQEPLNVAGKANDNEVAKSKTEAQALAEVQQGQQKTRPERPRGIYYTDGEYLYGPFGDVPDARENATTTIPLKAFTSPAFTGYDGKRNCVDGNDWQINKKAMKAQQSSQLRQNEPHVAATAHPPSKNSYRAHKSELMEVPAAEQHRNNAAEIAALETKYGLFQQSIAEHLRQIDTYMENAKVALSRSLPQPKMRSHMPGEGGAQQQQAQVEQPISEEIETKSKHSELLNQQVRTSSLPTESPLQALARQLLQHPPLRILNVTDDNVQAVETLLQPIVLENMPVVEQALQDLSAIKVEDGKATVKLSAKHVKNAKDLEIQSADDGSILQPLMHRLIAVPCKQPSHNVLPSTKPSKVASKEEGLLRVEHHFAPTPTLAKRVTILENLDEASARAAGRKPTNIALIETEDGDKVDSVGDEIAIVKGKIDDSNNCENSADNGNINDVGEADGTSGKAQNIGANENGNFKPINSATEGVGKLTVQLIKNCGRTGDVSITKLISEAPTKGAPEHVVDVVANYEQLATTAISSVKQETQQKQQDPPISHNGMDIWPTYSNSAPTTPLTRRRTTSTAVEEKVASATATLKCKESPTEVRRVQSAEGKPVSRHWMSEAEQRQQQHERLQRHHPQSQQAPKPPTPPPLPPPPLQPLRAGSLPKELCKNVVSGYISTHQSQEQLVEQVIDVLQLDVVTTQQQQQAEQLTIPRVETEQEQANNNELVATNQVRPKCTLAEHQQQHKPPTKEQLNQEQSAISPTMKSNQKSKYYGYMQSTEISDTAKEIEVHIKGASKSAHNTVAAADAELARQKLEPKESTSPLLVSEAPDKRTIHGIRGQLTVHINEGNKKHQISKSADSFDTYKATYDIPSPCFKQQITWKHSVDMPRTSGVDTRKGDNNEVQIDVVSQTMPAAEETKTESHPSFVPQLQSVKQQSMSSSSSAASPRLQQPNTMGLSRSRSVSPRAKRASCSPTRKYPAALIEPHASTRAASPYGLNPLDITELIDDGVRQYAATSIGTDDTAAKIKHIEHSTPCIQCGHTKAGAASTERTTLVEFVPQVEGHNVGLLVRAPIAVPVKQQNVLAANRVGAGAMTPQDTAKAQIEMDTALTHSAVTHYADAEASTDDNDDDDDDEDDGVEEADQRQRRVAPNNKHGIAFQRRHNKAHAVKRTAPLVPLTPSPSLVSCARADGTQTPPARQARITTTNGQTQLLPDSSATDFTSTAIGKLQMSAQLQSTHTPTGEVKQQDVFRSQAEQQQRQQQQQHLAVPGNHCQQQSLDMLGEPAVALHHHHQCAAMARESGIINRSFDNVSPRPYITAIEVRVFF